MTDAFRTDTEQNDARPDTDPRPELARLSERILNQEAREYSELFDNAVDALHRPRVGSLWALDHQVAGKNKLAIAALQDGAVQGQRLAFSAAGHTEVLRLLMRHDRLLLVPAWTNSRAVLEPILMTCWLTDPSVSAQMRLARSASLMPAILEGNIAQLARFADQEDELEQKHQTRAELITYYERNGFRIHLATDKKGKPKDEIGAVTYEKQRASTSHNITEMARQYVPDAPFLYGLLSGATHSKLWLLNGLGADADEAILSIMNLLLPISDAYTKTLCTYLGLDPIPYLTRRDRRRIALARKRARTSSSDRATRATAFGEIGRFSFVDELMNPGPQA